jgi:osmotically-inducible protein OsmY
MQDLQADITAELEWDPMVDHDGVIVTADEGEVTLRGSAASLRHIR